MEELESNRCKLFEHIKQFISIRKIISRNLDRSYGDSTQESHYFPVLLLKGSKVKVDQDVNKQTLAI